MEKFEKIILTDDERVDILPNGKKIIQSNSCFSYGIDAVLLSFFSKVKKGGTCLDLGTGNCIIPLLMSSRFPKNNFHAIEIQEKSFSMAERSILLNNSETHVTVFLEDIKNPWGSINKNSYSTVTANPPYMLKDTGNISLSDEKAFARHEILSSLDDFCSCAYFALNDSGSFFMIHRANRLNDVIESLKKNGFSPKNLIFIHSNCNSDATMFIVESVKGGNSSFCNIKKPLFVYELTGAKSQNIMDIYNSF